MPKTSICWKDIDMLGFYFLSSRYCHQADSKSRQPACFDRIYCKYRTKCKQVVIPYFRNSKDPNIWLEHPLPVSNSEYDSEGRAL